MTRLPAYSRLAAATVLCVGVLPLGASADASASRTETKLAGFTVGVQASPVLVLLDDPKLEVPRPTGSSVLEADPNYTEAQVAAGPTAHAISSTLWPGNIVGNGLSAFNPSIPPYPLKAESRYPDKPYTATGVDGGVLTTSSAEGLDAKATAKGTPVEVPGQLRVGEVASNSTATVDGHDQAVGTAASAVHNIDVLGGLIHIGSVTTHLQTSADGKKPFGTGRTTVAGLTVAGQSFTVDDTGIHAGPQSSSLPPLTSPSQLAQAGITFSGVVQSSSATTNGIKRSAAGLVITVRTAPLRAALSPVLGPLNSVLSTIISNLPPNDQGNFYYLLKATPQITYVFGAAQSASAATLPISFSFPPPGLAGGPLSGGPGSSAGGASSLNGAGSLGSAAVPPSLAAAGVPSLVAPGAPEPVLQAPSSYSAAAATSGFAGIAGGWTLLALGASGLIGWGLIRFLGLAGGLLGGCRLGAPTSLPDLRSVPA
ncbi:MAG: hypothetical protein NVS3B26_26090 [Mycobacteriales bacterium]